MSGTIKNVLVSNFLKKKSGTDVYILAAQTLAVQCLEEAWRELEQHRVEIKQKSMGGNPGL